MNASVYTLTASELMELVRLRRLMEPAADGVVRTDSAGSRRRMAARIAALYAQAVATLPAADLPVEELAAEVIAAPAADAADLQAGRTTLSLPARCLRVIDVRLSGWLRAAEPVAPSSPEALAQASPWSRAGTCRPVAVSLPGGVLALYPAGQPASLRCVTAPKNDTYLLTPTLQEWIISHY